MHWFKVVLLIALVLSITSHSGKAFGLITIKPDSQKDHFIEAIIEVLLLLGVWGWMDVN